ncbi:MAG: DUF3667 domain-containing protein [Bacteroidota bacterium]
MSERSTLYALADPEDEPHDPEAVPASGDPECANCGATLTGRYCAGCGQLDQPLRMPVHRFLAQAFVEFFGLDGRVWKTLGVLLVKPGKLTEAYLRGQRRRYLRPLRVYLSSTLLFFFLLSVLDPVGRLQGSIVSRDGLADTTLTAGAYAAYLDSLIAAEDAEVVEQQALVDSLRQRVDRLRATFPADSLVGPEAAEDARDVLDDALDDLEDEMDDLERIDNSTDDRRLVWQREQVGRFPADSLIRADDLVAASELVVDAETELEINMGPFTRGRASQRLETARTTEERVEAGLDVAREAIGRIPVVMFLMLPVFALLFKVVYARRGWFYSEHLVFGLHTHAFAFVVFAVIAVLAGLGGAAWGASLALASGIGIPLYFLIAQKRVYGQGWIKTLVKAGLLGGAYLFVLLVFGFTLTVVLALLA